jgi:hypothetical protein
MRAGLITLALVAAWALVENLPAAWAAALGLATLAGIIAASIALAVKWVRNV